MKPILITEAGNRENQDRGLIISAGIRVVLCIADGAGGRNGGTEAAVMATDFVRQHAARAINAGACVELLRQMDGAIARDNHAGETTCVLAVVTPTEVFGASVGDSGAWLIPATGDWINLTQAQQRKPFIGAGGVQPIPFWHLATNGSLLMATDGLFKYTSPKQVVTACREHPTDVAARKLIQLVRYPSGALPDDVTIILGDFLKDA